MGRMPALAVACEFAVPHDAVGRRRGGWMPELNGPVRRMPARIALAGAVLIGGYMAVAEAYASLPHTGAPGSRSPASVAVSAGDTLTTPGAETGAPAPAPAPESDADISGTPRYSERDLATIELLDRLSERGAAGFSGSLRASVMLPAEYAPVSMVSTEAGVNTLVDPRSGAEHSLITLVPFAAKSGRTTLDGYRMGFWPAERGAGLAHGELPDGFIKVTEENQHTRVSDNFVLRDFLTKDQFDTWPKYLVLSLDLVDKLELMLVELREMGYDARRLHVMSGFRTPQYNAGGEGRASNSRHQYGDAADVFVDNGNAGRMDDLNGDGRVNLADARIIVQAAERVEQKYPSLVGGIGAYAANSAHPPFVHVDTRGTRARWGEGGGAQ